MHDADRHRGRPPPFLPPPALAAMDPDPKGDAHDARRFSDRAMEGESENTGCVSTSVFASSGKALFFGSFL
ncbi:MAG: hypothetical protein ACTHOH_04890 [Lysobacteraceae bacterium]